MFAIREKFLYILTMQEFQQWLKTLSQELNLNEDLVLDEKNQCFLMFDDTMLVEIEYNDKDQQFLFKGSLGNIEDWQTKQIYQRLLEANMLWKETQGALFGLQQYSDKVVLIQHTPVANCDYKNFESCLATFVNTFEYWLKHLAEMQAQHPKKSSSKANKKDLS